jgi:hypothetical protein
MILELFSVKGVNDMLNFFDLPLLIRLRL